MYVKVDKSQDFQVSFTKDRRSISMSARREVATI
jgi:hypothetical protein